MGGAGEFVGMCAGTVVCGRYGGSDEVGFSDPGSLCMREADGDMVAGGL